MKKSTFTTFEQFHESGVVGDIDHLTVINYDTRVCADVLTEAKSIEMAVKKFFTACKGIELFDGWREQALELMSNGVFSVHERGSYSFEVEELHDDFFYVMLTVWR